MYREVFEPAGYEIVEASDGLDALSQSLSQPPSVVIAELNLPSVDGFPLCENLRRDPATQKVPILIVTSDARPSSREQARLAGANAVIVKPILPDDILHEVERLRAKHAAQPERRRGRTDVTLREQRAALERAWREPHADRQDRRAL